jgi:hypothetical protein
MDQSKSNIKTKNTTKKWDKKPKAASPRKPSYCEKAKEVAKRYKNEGNEIIKSITAHQIIAFTTIFIAYFTFRYMGAAFEQVSQMKETVKITRETLTSTQRAFVSFKDITIVKVSYPKSHKILSWRVIVNVENSGNTPALNMLSQVYRKTIENPAVPLSQDYIFTVKPEPISLGPRAAVGIGPLEIPIDELMEVYNHTKRLYIYGFVTYEDIMENTPTHTTRFCLEVAGMARPPSDPKPGTQIMLIAHPTYEEKSKR